MQYKNERFVEKTLVGRALSYCHEYKINMFAYLLNNSYRNSVKRRLAQPVAPGVNGVVDSVRLLLSKYNNTNRGILTNMLSAI